MASTSVLGFAFGSKTQTPGGRDRGSRLRIEKLEDRCLMAARPWEFLSATSQIQQISDSGSTNVFRAIQHADFNKDGKLDFVSSQARSSAGVSGTNYPSVLYINENGKFNDRTAQYFPDLLTPAVRWWTVPHDFFNTGWIDLYVGGANGQGSKFYKNLGADGGGNWLGFQDQSFRIRGPGQFATDSYHQHKCDIDLDNRMDIIEYQNHPESGFGQIRALINTGRVFKDETSTRMPQRQEPSIFGHCDDYTGDGYPDITISNLLPSGNIPELRLLVNDGTGHFPVGLEQTLPQPIGSIGTYGLDHGDYNGDGKLDIYSINFGIAGNGARDAILLNLGTGSNLFNTVYYPTFNGKDSDGDHAVSVDFDGDGKTDIAVAQFATKTFILRNESIGTGGIPTFVEKTPPEIPSGAAFRLRAFDGNGDGVQDLFIGHDPVNQGISYTIGNVGETEPNEAFGQAQSVATFPALVTGVLSTAGDKDVFALPARAYNEGTTVRLRPAAGVDLRLQLLDAAGNVLSTSQSGGNGGTETLNAGAGTLARFVKVELQGTLGSGIYRLDIDTL